LLKASQFFIEKLVQIAPMQKKNVDKGNKYTGVDV